MARQSFDHLRLYRDSRDGLLKSDCYVMRPHLLDPSRQAPPSRRFVAMWDTGSNTCMVSKQVIGLCQLIPEGFETVRHVSGEARVPAYTVGLTLPNGPEFSLLRVLEGKDNGYDVLIGMNIINQGDLIVLNGGDKTEALFRYPSTNDEGLGLIDRDNTTFRPDRTRSNERGSQRR